MFHIKKLIITGLLASCLSSTTVGQDTPITRWGAEPGKIEAPAADQVKKLSAEIADFKSRLQQMEDGLVQQNTSLKSQFQAMQSKLSSLHATCDRLQRDGVAAKTATPILQTSATEPAARKLVEDGPVVKSDAGSQDQVMKRLDDILHEMSKSNLQVQANTRDLNDLKKKHDALQLEFIQAQNDIGKLQQDMVKWSARYESGRIQADPNAGTDRSRQSLALPLPPDTQGNTAPRSIQGALKLINNYPLAVTVVVDGQFYTLRTNDSMTLNRSPGYVTYEVLGIQGNTLRTINAGETLSVQIVAR